MGNPAEVNDPPPESLQLYEVFPKCQPRESQQFSLWTRRGRRVRAPGLQEGGFVGNVGRVPSPGGG